MPFSFWIFLIVCIISFIPVCKDHGEALRDFKEATPGKRYGLAAHLAALWFVPIFSLVGTIFLGIESVESNRDEARRDSQSLTFSNELNQTQSSATNALVAAAMAEHEAKNLDPLDQPVSTVSAVVHIVLEGKNFIEVSTNGLKDMATLSLYERLTNHEPPMLRKLCYLEADAFKRENYVQAFTGSREGHGYQIVFHTVPADNYFLEKNNSTPPIGSVKNFIGRLDKATLSANFIAKNAKEICVNEYIYVNGRLQKQFSITYEKPVDISAISVNPNRPAIQANEPFRVEIVSNGIVQATNEITNNQMEMFIDIPQHVFKSNGQHGGFILTNNLIIVCPTNPEEFIPDTN